MTEPAPGTELPVLVAAAMVGAARSAPAEVGTVEQTIVSLRALRMSTRDIEDHLHETYGPSASRELISYVVDQVSVEHVSAGRSAPRRTGVS